MSKSLWKIAILGLLREASTPPKRPLCFLPRSDKGREAKGSAEWPAFLGDKGA